MTTSSVLRPAIQSAIRSPDRPVDWGGRYPVRSEASTISLGCIPFEINSLLPILHQGAFQSLSEEKHDHTLRSLQSPVAEVCRTEKSLALRFLEQLWSRPRMAHFS